ncbi:MAG: DUF1080 domain-containing protein [Candidatus Marinimicrobia bacterium]|jgi:hypothetical protein|nr:DUF1080 domain-containing protein [Candidatus Neomarinimicrobiota bacterium]MBT3840185.1 DUF1080 domain-containing protein [Candidatus Neomarinimicrobiota bacterium]MBT3999179.1 DUF1080 domain-containing protein [Candidatus Neomarinimicrobiota bacterium]MBT4282615.1 DUF1080 domain-containing protein [Candidatus Neomarinimicrobiota bacterium]MBT4579711.1 DUF1080 domain-containing protein [Candidatus Neomarinimicrobiota bacterium]
MNKKYIIGLVTIIAVVFATTMMSNPSEKGWESLFNGKDLTGWRASENGDFRVEDGAIVVRGNRAHLFSDREFTNFEFKCEIMTSPNSNSGLYFHTQYEESWPSRGYEVQVNTSHGDPVKNGSLWGVVRSFEPMAKDNEWFTLSLKVEGKHVVTKVNSNVVVDYNELEGVTAGRRIDKGSFAIQAHDPKSMVRYRNIMVRELD